MKKYNKPIFEEKYIQQALKINLWERLLLLFVPTTTVINNEGTTKFKKLFGKFYLTDFQLKEDLLTPSSV